MWTAFGVLFLIGLGALAIALALDDTPDINPPAAAHSEPETTPPTREDQP